MVLSPSDLAWSRLCVEIVLVGGYALSVGAARFKLGYLGLACGAGVATSIFFLDSDVLLFWNGIL
jgi:hypothetical protein